MTEANKKTVKQVVGMLGAFGVLVVIIHVIPDGSTLQNIFSYIMGAALVGIIVYFTGLGNPVRALYRKIFNKKEGE